MAPKVVPWMVTCSPAAALDGSREVMTGGRLAGGPW
jgi:hypothetical protein